MKRKEVHETAAPYVNVVDGRSLRFEIVTVTTDSWTPDRLLGGRFLFALAWNRKS